MNRATALRAPLLGRPPLPRIPQPERRTLRNGLRLALLPMPQLPQVALRLLVPAGAVTDPEARPGLAALTGALLTEGTTRRDGEAINRALDRLGASLSVTVGHDWTEIDLTMLSGTEDRGLALLGEILAQASFPEREFARVRAETLDELRARADEPANVADDALAAAIFGAHPYGRPAVGTAEGVEGIDRAAVVEHHTRTYRPEGSVLVAGGRFEVDGFAAAVESALADWAGRPAVNGRPPAPAAAADAGRTLVVAVAGSAQAELRVGGLGLRRSDELWPAASVANYVLGGSTITGRLGANLREEKGWTYGARSGFAAAVESGAWVVETAVDSEVAGPALGEIRAELERFVSEGPTEQELRRSRDALILSLPRAFETAARAVARFATVEAYSLPEDYWQRYLEAVARTDDAAVRGIAARFFAPDRLVWLAAGPDRL